MTSLLTGSIQPGKTDISTADAALGHVQAYLTRHPQGPEKVRFLVPGDGEEFLAPRTAVELLARVLAHMASGHGVSVVPTYSELTTQQAANLLNVSRPYLISLLEAGQIEYRKVGKHRRVQTASLLDYMRHDDQRRREAADELSPLTQQMGLA